MALRDTIFALSSGSPPAAIAVIRISGPDAQSAVRALAGSPPEPRTAKLRRLRAADGSLLDQALVLWFPGPATATGEDLAELHLHGGRAVVRAVEAALAELPGLRSAFPGEFTRRAFAAGRIDLAEAEGLADLLTAETELQRRQALALADGTLSARIRSWRDRVLLAGAAVEAMLDFGDEDDADQLPATFYTDLATLARELTEMLAAPRAEILRTGFQVVLAGPPNSGKSSLFNRLLNEEAAITAPVAGTTRDVLTRPVSFAGIPFVFADTAGLRDETSDSIEQIGIARAHQIIDQADLVLWLGPEGEGTGRHVWELESFADAPAQRSKQNVRHRVSAMSGEGITALTSDLIEFAQQAMPGPGQLAINHRQHGLLEEAASALIEVHMTADPLIIAECLRVARSAFDRLVGVAATEDMLDALFDRFCIGK